MHCDCDLSEHPHRDDCLIYAILEVARALNRLGNADANTPMGGLEALGLALRDGLHGIALEISAKP